MSALMYRVDYDAASDHIPAHPERTVVGCTNPFSFYYQEFDSRQAMLRWLKRQSWAERQKWSAWMASAHNRQLLAIARSRRSYLSSLKARRTETPQDKQMALFV